MKLQCFNLVKNFTRVAQRGNMQNVVLNFISDLPRLLYLLQPRKTDEVTAWSNW